MNTLVIKKPINAKGNELKYLTFKVITHPSISPLGLRFYAVMFQAPIKDAHLFTETIMKSWMCMSHSEWKEAKANLIEIGFLHIEGNIYYLGSPDIQAEDVMRIHKQLIK